MSSGSPQGSADVREPDASQEPGLTHQSANTPRQGGGGDPGSSPADFGANEWLVEELYQRYLTDPSSVDRAWWSFFTDYQPALSTGTGPQPVLAAAPDAAVAPAAPPAAENGQSAPNGQTGTGTQAANGQTATSAADAGPAPAPAAAPAQQAAPARPAAASPPPSPAAPAGVPSPAEGTEVSRLRGAAARTATNMAASLTVPTATSTRPTSAAVSAPPMIEKVFEPLVSVP